MNDTQERIDAAAQAGARLQELSTADQTRREFLLSYNNLLTADMDKLITELAEIDGRIALYGFVTRLHQNYQTEFLNGVRNMAH